MLVALVIGTIELGGLVASQLGLSGVFWDWFEHIDINLLGFVIVAMFIATWVAALAIDRVIAPVRVGRRWTSMVRRGQRLEGQRTAADLLQRAAVDDLPGHLESDSASGSRP